jgi:hypothetical protein
LLSEVEPTRADMLSQTAWGGRLGEEVGRVVDFLGRKGVKCFASRRGPMVLIAKVLFPRLAECYYLSVSFRKKKINVPSKL